MKQEIKRERNIKLKEVNKIWVNRSAAATYKKRVRRDERGGKVFINNLFFTESVLEAVQCNEVMADESFFNFNFNSIYGAV